MKRESITLTQVLPFIWILLVVLLAFFALAYAMPHLLQIPDVDSSIFLYFGQAIREGKTVYRDVYDHKPPLIFYTDALGLTLGNGSRWGVWAIELVSVAAAGLLGFKMLRRSFGVFPALVGIAGFLVNLTFFHEGGNLTEEYALPFQFLAIFLLVWMETRNKRPGWLPFWIGVALGLASSYKQPLAGGIVGIGIVMLAVRLSRRNWRGMLDFVWLGLGGLAVWGVWFVVFAAQGALADLWEAAFAYNFSLSEISKLQRLDAVIWGIERTVNFAPFFAIILSAWLVLLPFILFSSQVVLREATRRWVGLVLALGGLLSLNSGLIKVLMVNSFQPETLFSLSPYRITLTGIGLILLGGGLAYFFVKLDRKLYPALRPYVHEPKMPMMVLLGFALVDLPVEVVLTSLSGNNYKHYFMALMPSLSIIAAFFTWWLISQADLSKKRLYGYFWAGAFLIPLLVPGILETADKIQVNRDPKFAEVIQFVVDNTSPSDTVLQWGDFPMINVVSGRRAPSKFFFIDPLFLPGYTSLVHTGPYLAELKANPPKLLLDASAITQPLFYEDKVSNCPRMLDPEYLAERIRAEGKPTDERALKYFQPAQIPEGMPEVYLWFCQNYVRGRLFDFGWTTITVYSYAPNRK
jgi:4-amino-4-deoxy-L-arabinose transferase-like glycosyltransferase